MEDWRGKGETEDSGMDIGRYELVVVVSSNIEHNRIGTLSSMVIDSFDRLGIGMMVVKSWKKDLNARKGLA